MSKTLLVLGNGFDLDLGIELTLKKYRESSHCLSYEFDKCHPKGDCWNDFEETLRQTMIDWCNSSRDEETAKSINLFWRGFWRYFSAFFTENTQDYPETKSVKHNYAYAVLQHLNSNSSVYTFNYTFPYDYVNDEAPCDFKFVHGRYHKDTFKKEMATMLQSHEMILGIDNEHIPTEIKNNEYLRPIIKQLNTHFKDSGIVSELCNAETVIFFGHSLGITDADYFDKFFSMIFQNTSVCKTIYIVTYDSNALSNIIENVKSWGGGDITCLYKYGVRFIPIYTEEKNMPPEFFEMLNLL
jgi:NAD-dependent SIR2 family protein deacetylase